MKGLTKTLRVVDRWLERNKNRDNPAAIAAAQCISCGLGELVHNPDAKILTKMAEARDALRAALGSDAQ